MDVEISASGFTKEMEEDLNEVLHTEEQDDEEDEEGDDEAKQETKVKQEDTDNENTDLEKLQNEVSSALKELKVEDEDEKETEEDIHELPGRCMKQRLDSCMAESISGFSMCSRSTQATIAPEVIRNRVKKSFEKGDKMQVRRRVQAKGEASATTRQRRENRDTIKQSQGIWG